MNANLNTEQYPGFRVAPDAFTPDRLPVHSPALLSPSFSISLPFLFK